MSSASFRCSFCHELTTVPLSRLVKAQALRCETCYSISSLSDRMRAEMVDRAEKRRTGEE